jgi:hypothetical protein
MRTKLLLISLAGERICNSATSPGFSSRGNRAESALATADLDGPLVRPRKSLTRRPWEGQFPRGPRTRRALSRAGVQRSRPTPVRDTRDGGVKGSLAKGQSVWVISRDHARFSPQHAKQEQPYVSPGIPGGAGRSCTPGGLREREICRAVATGSERGR